MPDAQVRSLRKGEASYEDWVKKITDGVNNATPRFQEVSDEITDDLQHCVAILKNQNIPLYFDWNWERYQTSYNRMQSQEQTASKDIIPGIDTFEEQLLVNNNNEDEFDPNEEDSDGQVRPLLEKFKVYLVRLEQPPFWQLARFLVLYDIQSFGIIFNNKMS